MPLPSSESAELLDKFKAKIIAHPHLKSAFASVMELIDEPADVKVAAIIGPTGAGKSTLLDRVKQAILTKHQAAMEANPGLLPVVSVEAPAPESGTFSWREMNLRILVELKEPVCDWQVALKANRSGKPGVTRLSSLTQVELKVRVGAGCRNRGAKVVLIDEAQLLGKMGSGRRLLDQTETIKDLAKSTDAFIVLFGTYDLIPLLGLNGQVARRFASIHLPRYRCDDEVEWEYFRTALRSFGAEIHLPNAPDLVREAKMYYRDSVGCIGILKSRLTSAYAQVLRTNGTALTDEILDSTRLPTSSLRKIAEEIEIGEKHWAQSYADDRELDRLIGLDAIGSNTPAKLEQESAIRPQKTVVGRRKPSRDPVGMAAANV